ncbi:MAG: hypothetical protein JNJ48_07275 [Phycisphaerae bacterium]|nr:hypothetical protein [Phycisphaerae bacterium]
MILLSLCLSFNLLQQPPAPPRPAETPVAPQAAQPPRGVDRLQNDARAAGALVTTALARAFVAAADGLPTVEPRSLYQHPATRAWLTPEQAAALPESERAALKPRVLDEEFYYTTRYGSPLAYARAIDLIGAREPWSRRTDLRGTRVMDFGCGGMGPVRLLAMMGADTVGVDVDPLLGALYSRPGDQGSIGQSGGVARLVIGQWPGDSEAAAAVGARFDLILSKNTLKRGYIHPEREADPRTLVRLGVSDERFVRSMYEALKPGGLVMIYNLSPAPSKPDQPYKPWADGRCPFDRPVLEAVGFEVLEFDRTDDAAARLLGKALGWDAQGMDLENDLFAHWTLLRRPMNGAPAR